MKGKAMSARKAKIAQKVEALGLGCFDGAKKNGNYIIGMVSFKSLEQIEAYINAYQAGTTKVRPALASAKRAYVKAA